MVCGKVGSDICKGFKDAANSSFFPYLFVTFALNIPAFAFGLATTFSETCNSNWLVFNAFLCAMHMLVSVYTVYRIRAKRSKKGESKSFFAPAASQDEESYYASGQDGMNADSLPQKSQDGLPNSWKRIRAVMCYDMMMAVYYVLFLVWIVWQSNGARLILEAHPQDKECGRWIFLSVILGFLYMGLVIVAWTMSLCMLRYKKLSDMKNSLDDLA